MAYRLLPVAEARDFVARAGIRAEDVPPEGLLANDGAITVLVFRKTSGELLLVDVTSAVPPHFAQAYPAPPGFWAEVSRRTVELPGEVLRWAGGTIGQLGRGLGESLGGGGLLLVAGIVIGVLILNRKG
jgi:hypothetical protein